MQARQARRYAMLMKVLDFGSIYREQFPEGTIGAQAFAEIAAAVGQLKVRAVARVSAARGGTSTRAAARAALVSRLDTIRRTARAIAQRAPGFDDPFRFPKRYPDLTILTTGQAFVNHARHFEDRFIAYGLSPAFVTELESLVRIFEQSIRGCEAGKDSRTAADAGIVAALAAGLAAARTLDVIVVNQLSRDPVAMAVWLSARQIGHPRQVRKPKMLPGIAPEVPRPRRLTA